MSEAGMDVEVVRGIAAKLDGEAGRIAAVVTDVDRLLSGAHSDWLGRDAEQFVGWWNQQHRVALLALHDAIAGLAQSARNNASVQDTTSGSTEGGAGADSFVGSLLHGVGGPTIAAASLGAVLATGVGVLSGDRQLSTAGSFFRGAEAGSSTSGTTHGVGYQGAAQVRAGIGGEGHASAGIEGGALVAGVGGSAFAGVAASANGSLDYGIAHADGKADAFAGAQADADAKGHLGRDGVSAEAGGSAFAGAKASVEGHADVGGVGVGGGASAMAGAGVVARGEVKLTASDVKVNADLGAALGLGAEVHVSVEVNPEKAVRSFFHSF